MHELGLKVAVLRDADRAPERGGGEPAATSASTPGSISVRWARCSLVGADRGSLVRPQPAGCDVSSAFALAWTVLFAASARNLSAHYLLAALPFYVVAMAWVLVEAANAMDRRAGTLRASPAVLVGDPRACRGRFAARCGMTRPARSWPRPNGSQYVEGDWSGYGLPDAARWIERELRQAAPAADGSGEPVFVAVHLADYERLRLYAGESARRSIEQVQVDRYTLRVPTMIDRARAMLASGRRVFVVVGSERRFERRWRRAFPAAVARATFPKPGGAHARWCGS